MTPLEVEQWVLLASDVASPKHWEATAVLQAWSANVSSTSHDVAGTLVAVIQSTQHEQVLFYALTTFPRSPNDSTFEQRAHLRHFLLCNATSVAPSHLRTKAGVVLAHLIRTDFFQRWTTAFDDLRQQASPDLFCRTLQALMEDFDTFHPEEAASLKDAMRGYPPTSGQTTATAAVPAISTTTNTITTSLVDTLVAHATNYGNDDASLLVLILTVLKQFTSWIDMSLLLQDRVLHIVFLSLSSANSSIGVAAIGFLQELVGRGMDADLKLALLQETDLLRRIHEHVNLETLDVSPIEVVIEVAKLIDTTGQELVTIMEESNGNLAALSSLQTVLWPQLLELFFRCFSYDDIDVSGAVIPLACRLVKKDHLPTSKLLTMLYRQMRFPADYQFDYENDDEAEEEVYRGELRKLFQRLVHACPDMCLQFVCEALADLPLPLSTSATPAVEAALRLVYHYCEGIRPPPGMKVVMKNDTFRSLLSALHQSDITNHPHREVLLLYYDIAVRYYPIFLQQPELLPKVLQGLSGERGLQHAHAHVRSRSCYLLLRLVKSVIKVMRPYVETAVTGIQGLLSKSSGSQRLRQEDALYLFETMGLLLGKTGLAPGEQQNSLTQVIAPHIRSIEETLCSDNLERDPDYYGDVLAGSVAAIAYLSKGFSKAPLEVQIVLAETVTVTLAVLEALPGNEKVRSKVMIVLQRMIQCIGPTVLDVKMPRFLLLLLENCTAEDAQDVAQLFNQLCIKFKEDAIPAIDLALLPFLRKCHQLAQSVGEVNAGNSGIPPHLRTEQLSIQKLAFTVLQHIVSYGASSVLMSPTNACNLELVLQTMSDGAVHVDDAVMKKSCITFFRELVDQWTNNTCSNDAIQRGFVRFILEVFVPGMVECLLNPSFNEKDALQARNVSEFANILFILKTRPRTSDSFEQYVVRGAVANASCPSHVLEAFLKVSTFNEMERCLKDAIELQKSTT